MIELELKYGCNPNQKPARIFMSRHRGGELPLEVLNGKPGYINFLDALNSWQLVCELKKTLNIPAAASFKRILRRDNSVRDFMSNYRRSDLVARVTQSYPVPERRHPVSSSRSCICARKRGIIYIFNIFNKK